MKKLLAIVAGVALFNSVVLAETASLVIPAANMTNLLSGFNGFAKISQITIASAVTDSGSVRFYDSADGRLVWTNVAYSVVTKYPTNQITAWTNFFGSVNYMTNLALVTVTNTQAATTNSLPVKLAAVCGTNTSAIYDGVNYYFHNGVWVTNIGTGTVTIGITYTQ